VSETLFYRLCR